MTKANIEQTTMVDLLDLATIASKPTFTIGGRVWAESHVGIIREFCITGMRICALERDSFEVDGETIFVRGGVFDAREQIRWEYQISGVGGRNHGKEFGWLKADDLHAGKPIDSGCTIRETQPVPPMICEIV